MKTKIFLILAVLTAFFALSCENPGNLPESGNKIAFTGLSADGSVNVTTSKLTLTFDKDIGGLAVADITLTAGATGAVKDVLTRIAAGKYELSLKNIAMGGMVGVSVAKSGYTITGGPKQVEIYYKQGSIPGGDPSNIPEDLVAKWYTAQALADAGTGTATIEFTEEGKLLYMGIDNQLTITVEGNVISNYRAGSKIGTVKYTLSGTAINFSESTGEQVLSTSLTFYKKAGSQGNNDIAVAFTGLTADGSSTQTTTKLTLTFDKDIDGLSAGDITLDAGTTGATKGALTKTGTGTYELTISGITEGGMVSVSVSKSGYNITGGYKQIDIVYDNKGDFTVSGTSTLTITGYTGWGRNVIIPAEIDGIPVTAIKSPDGYTGSGVFSGMQLTSVVIPDSVTFIGDKAFPYNQLTSVTIPDSVTYIGYIAFYNNRLTNITIPNSVTSIGESAFRENQLTSVTIGNSVTSIGAAAFKNNQLTSVTIPDSVISIGGDYDSQSGGAFSYNQLVSVTIGNNVTSIGINAFSGNQLTSIVIPNSVVSIGIFAFSSNQLVSVTIGNSVTEIEVEAFRNNQLTSVIIPDSVNYIGHNAFRSNQLTSVTIGNSVTYIGADAFSGNQLTSVTIGANVTLGNSPSYSSFGDGFENAYNNTYNKAAGTYTRPDTSSEVWTKVN